MKMRELRKLLQKFNASLPEAQKGGAKNTAYMFYQDLKKKGVKDAYVSKVSKQQRPRRCKR